MKAIVYWDRRGHDLAPLTDHVSVCLQPVAGRAVIAHALDMLADLGVRDVAIASWSKDDRIMPALSNGAPWGMALRQLALTYENNEVEGWLAGEQEVLALRGDALISPVVKVFLDRAREVGGSFVHGMIGGRPVMALGRPWADGSWHFPVEPFGGRNRPAPVARSVSIEGADASLLEDLVGYHAANLRVIRGEFMGRTPFGRSQDNAIVGARAELATSVLVEGAAHIGAGSALRGGVALGGSVAIGDRVLVDEDTTIIDSVILPDTYIGSHLRVQNAIVAGNILIRVDTGAVLHVEDNFILAPLSHFA